MTMTMTMTTMRMIVCQKTAPGHSSCAWRPSACEVVVAAAAAAAAAAAPAAAATATAGNGNSTCCDGEGIAYVRPWHFARGRRVRQVRGALLHEHDVRLLLSGAAAVDAILGALHEGEDAVLRFVRGDEEPCESELLLLVRRATLDEPVDAVRIVLPPTDGHRMLDDRMLPPRVGARGVEHGVRREDRLEGALAFKQLRRREPVLLDRDEIPRGVVRRGEGRSNGAVDTRKCRLARTLLVVGGGALARTLLVVGGGTLVGDLACSLHRAVPRASFFEFALGPLLAISARGGIPEMVHFSRVALGKVFRKKGAWHVAGMCGAS